MSTVHFSRAVVFCLILLGFGASAHSQQGPIKPFKDDLFSNLNVLEVQDGGAFEKIEYLRQRDRVDRDRDGEKFVTEAYVSRSVRRHQEDETLNIGGRKIDVTRVGPASRAAFTVIFIHGRGGDRRLGVNDYLFGGNFNRLKNLSVENGGTYYSITIPSFDERGAGDAAALIRYASEHSPAKPVILACASMGSIICQHISRNPVAVRSLKAMVVLGGPADSGLPATPLAKARVPIYFAHGSADPVYKANDQVAVYRKLLKAGHSVRFALFETGEHGTPIRMVDWRKVLNFALSK